MIPSPYFPCILALCLASSVHAAPPKVIRATPDHADLGIDPALKSIRIEFDQDMDTRGRSICGGGPTFPKIEGEITWPDAHTIVIPVKLEPGKTYSFSINCPAAHNFASIMGESAESFPISFATRKDGDAAPSMTPEQTKSAIAALRKAIDERYSYRDLRHVNWDKVFAENTPKLTDAKTPSEFARIAAKTVAPAQDIHATVRVGEFVLPTFRRFVSPNLNVRELPKLLKDFKQCNNRVVTGTYEGVPYLLIGDWSGKAEDYDPALDFIEKNKDAPAMIVDVRPNSGGDELVARRVAGCFVSKPTVYSRNKTRDPSADGGWTAPLDRTIKPTEGREHFAGKVAVLIGKACMSSNESFIMMIKHGANAVLVGETTYGASGNPRPTDLGCGVTVILPTWVDLTPNDETLEGKGIAPDIAVKWTGESGQDAVLAEAVKQLKSK